jgi:hypothetical protein
MYIKDMVLGNESTGKVYHQKIGAEAGIAGLSWIFDVLSKDQLSHADSLRTMQKGVRVELAQLLTLDGARRILCNFAVQQTALANFLEEIRELLEGGVADAR